jgi:hypothetical protein
MATATETAPVSTRHTDGHHDARPGSASTTWSPVFGAVGDAFYEQALAVDPVNGSGATMSNAVYATIEP